MYAQLCRPSTRSQRRRNRQAANDRAQSHVHRRRLCAGANLYRQRQCGVCGRSNRAASASRAGPALGGVCGQAGERHRAHGAGDGGGFGGQPLP